MAYIDRRTFLDLAAGAVALGAVSPWAGAAAEPGFFSTLKDRARSDSTTPYSPPLRTKSDLLTRLTPEQFAGISFDPEAALWRDGGGYEAWYLKPGVYANELIALNELSNGAASPIAYDPGYFSTDHLGETAREIDAGGFNGFKVLYPLHPRNSWKDELIVFRGASYFRFLGRNQWYGLSARGLAIDAGGAKPEEFPLFREFWLQRPESIDAPLVIFALLDSASICGAYRFEIQPGDDTVIDVETALFPRRRIEKVGIAPLTSMYLHDRASPGFEDKGAVHDSNGLALLTGDGEWIWRPLVPRLRPTRTAFQDSAPRGFGLFQRNRRADDYAMPEYRYSQRPSYWVEPAGDWGPGQVELVEFPNNDVNFDNIVAFWKPDEPLVPGRPVYFSYRITATKSVPGWSAGGHAVSQSVTLVDGDGKMPWLDARVDFQGSRLAGLSNGDQIMAILESRDASVENPKVTVNPKFNRVRVQARIRNVSGKSAELRAYLRLGDNVLTETWSHLWTA